METWLVLSGLVAVAGIGAAAAVWLIDSVPKPDAAQRELTRGLDRTPGRPIAWPWTASPG